MCMKVVKLPFSLCFTKIVYTYKHKLIGHIDIKNYVQISVKNMNKELRMINIIK